MRSSGSFGSVGDPATVTEVVQALAERGWDEDFVVRGNQVRCGSCGALVSADELSIDEVYRFEGPSDPGDEMIVVALTCTRCGRKGTVVSAYGPGTDPDEAELLLALRDGR